MLTISKFVKLVTNRRCSNQRDQDLGTLIVYKNN